MPLSVIGVGLPRTGTLSLKMALETLGYAPCHHMREVFARPHLAPLWERAFDGTLGDWEEIFHDYRATTDAPSVHVYEQLAARYPDAKLVLTVRDEDAWYASLQRTIFSAEHRERLAKSRVRPMLDKMAAYQAKKSGSAPIAGTASAGMPSKEVMLPMFRAHRERALRTFGPERLLTFEVTEGWEKLCRFLDKPVPQTPFPRGNDSAEFHEVRVDGPAVT